MCVDSSQQGWERPATQADCAVLEKHFSGIDFADLLAAMSEDDARPLTTDLVLLGAMMHTQPDAQGMRYVPFSAIETAGSQNIIKLPVMDKVVEWFENTALGTDMWQNASDWCELKMGSRVHFAMNCGCGLVAVAAYRNGLWQSWKQNFNHSRAHLFGRTQVIRRTTDDLTGLDVTPAQLLMWRRMRACLQELASLSCTTEKRAA
jgi:hypothetical protein